MVEVVVVKTFTFAVSSADEFLVVISFVATLAVKFQVKNYRRSKPVQYSFRHFVRCAGLGTY